MAKFEQKVRIKTATEGTNLRRMKACHDTTINFGQLNLMKAKFLERGKGKIKPWTYINMEPLPQPTWGEVRFCNRIYFIPMLQIFKGYDDFKEDNFHVTGVDSTVNNNTLPYANNNEIVKAIMNMMTRVNPGPGVVPTTYDKAIYNATAGEIWYYDHNTVSWQAHKLLEQAGIKLRWKTDDNTPINIIRLLALAKVYIDYYYNNAYAGDLDYTTVKQLIERDNGRVDYDQQDITELLLLCSKTFYDSSYFVSAWDNPNHPNLSNQESTYSIPDPNNPINLGSTTTNQRVTNVDGNSDVKDPMIQGTTAATGFRPTEVLLNMLKALTNYLKRNQLAGASTLQRMLARYGVAPTSEMIKKSKLVGTITWGMNVSPVFNQADLGTLGGDALGSYSGYAYALSEKNKEFNLETTEDGILIETLTAYPVESYVQGIDGENLALTRLELPTPEYDNVGVDMISKAELLRGDSYDEDCNQDDNMWVGGFGFTPRYSRWKEMRDTISGNFTYGRLKNIYLPYTLARLMSTALTSTDIVHSKGFTELYDMNQYNRIFYDQGKNFFDYFRVHHELEIEWYSWMKPLYDYYDWEHEGGRDIELINNGPENN